MIFRVGDMSRKYKALVFIVGAAVVAFVLLITVAIFGGAETTSDIRDTQQQNSPLIRNTDRTLQRVLSCTSPGKRCYERGQRQTAKAVGDINRVIILAAACAPLTPGDVDAITACVVDGLSKKP